MANMNMDEIKDKIGEVVEALTKDNSLKKQFEEEPVKVIEKLLGVDLPDDLVEKIIDGVKAKITVGNISKAASALKGLFQ